MTLSLDNILIIGGILATAFAVWSLLYRASLNVGDSRWSSALVLGAVLFGWLGAAMILGIQGFFVPSFHTRFPAIALAALPVVIGTVLLFLFDPLKKLVTAIPMPWLVGIQFYRILGGIFVLLYAQQQLPGVFAFPAGIGDLITGITAPFVGYLLATHHPAARRVAIVWNLFGMTDLVQAVALGFLSAPGPYQRLAFDAPNLAIGQFPLVLIPTFAVPLSLLLHFFSLRGLLRRGAPIRQTVSARSGATV